VNRVIEIVNAMDCLKDLYNVAREEGFGRAGVS